MQHRRWHVIRSEHGSNVAQAAAVAMLAAALIAALLGQSQPLSAKVSCAFQRLVASLDGATVARCGPGGGAPPLDPQPPAPSNPPGQPPSEPGKQEENTCDKAVKSVLDTLVPPPSCISDTTTGVVKLNGDVTIPTP